MQIAMDFGLCADIAFIRTRLSEGYGGLEPIERRRPVAQLVRSLIGSRTKDPVSNAAFATLVRIYPSWDDVLSAEQNAIEATIRDVTFAERKASQILGALRIVSRAVPDFDLSFLGRLPVEQAMDWLMRLPGVGAKVAAATLNFSTLDRKMFVADSHVLRVLGRYGIVGPEADADHLQRTVTNAMVDWASNDLAELHRLVKRHGQTTCPKPRPRCGECPLADRCRQAARKSSRGRAPSATKRDPARPA